MSSDRDGGRLCDHTATCSRRSSCVGTAEVPTTLWRGSRHASISLGIAWWQRPQIARPPCAASWQVLVSVLGERVRRYSTRTVCLKRMVTKVQRLCWKSHDNWVAYTKIWSRRSLHRICGRAQTYWSLSDVFDSLRPCYVMLKFETKIPRSVTFVQVILISRDPNAPKF